MKSYGSIDSSWDKTKFHSLLEDASNMCKELDESVYIGTDGDEIILSQQSDAYLFHILACTVTKPVITEEMKEYSQDQIHEYLKKEFQDDDSDNRYTIEQMTSRVYECLIHGTKRYGKLTSQEDKEEKLFGAFIDAHNTINKRKKPFIVGYTKDGIMLAPISEISRFFLPLACVIDNNRTCWSLSDMHSHVLSSHITEKDGICKKLHQNIWDLTKDYGKFEAKQQYKCIIRLESAFEDAVRMAVHFDETFVVGLGSGHYSKEDATYYNTIKICKEDKIAWHDVKDSFIKVQPDKFLDNNILLVEKITEAAYNAFAIFHQVYKKHQITKSYGKVDSSWDKEKIRGILEDASDMANRYSMSFCIVEDKDENIIIVPNLSSYPRYLLACGIKKEKNSNHDKEDSSTAKIEKKNSKEFWDHVGYRYYTIDEMVPRVYDVLVNGIVTYGGLGFLSEGRIQLDRILNDATKLRIKYAKPFIVGKSKENGIMIAPISERTKFIDPLSLVIAKSGYWSLSDMHSDNIIELYREDPMHTLYNGMGHREKTYGRFMINKDMCITNLESAFEDAVKMPMRDDESYYYVVFHKYGRITINPQNERFPKNTDVKFIKVEPKEFWDGSILSGQKITAAAKDAYEKFYQFRKENAANSKKA